MRFISSARFSLEKMWKNMAVFPGEYGRNWGNTAWVHMAGLGSIGRKKVICLEVSCSNTWCCNCKLHLIKPSCLLMCLRNVMASFIGWLFKARPTAARLGTG